jgi:hypothetical protein
MPTSPSSPGGWAWIRAVFIAFHLTAITLMAFPAPSGGMSKKAWKQPTVQAEFRAWRERLARMGVEMSPDEFEARLWGLATGFMTARTRALKPFAPYYRYCGTSQSWRMFVAPHRFPARLELRIEEGGRWRTIYEMRHPEHDWYAAHFDHDRMRAGVFRYGWPQYASHYKRFSEFYARRALADFPEATAFESRFFSYRTLSPDEASAGMDPDGRLIASRVTRR